MLFTAFCRLTVLSAANTKLSVCCQSVLLGFTKDVLDMLPKSLSQGGVTKGAESSVDFSKISQFLEGKRVSASARMQ